MAGLSVLFSVLCTIIVYCSHALPLSDATALLQSASTLDLHPTLAKRYYNLFKEVAKEVTNKSALAFPEFDCDAHPFYCQEPFNCHSITVETSMRWVEEGIASRGPDHGALCTFARNELYYHECLAKRNPIKAARMQYMVTRENLHEEGNPETDASYCFIEGLCVEDDVTENSTVDDMAKVCDRRYGRARWSVFGSGTNSHEDSINAHGEVRRGKGFETRRQAEPFSLASCALGTFHCDIVACKETYCKDETARRRYLYQSIEEGWVKDPHTVLRSSIDLTIF